MPIRHQILFSNHFSFHVFSTLRCSPALIVPPSRGSKKKIKINCLPFSFTITLPTLISRAALPLASWALASATPAPCGIGMMPLAQAAFHPLAAGPHISFLARPPSPLLARYACIGTHATIRDTAPPVPMPREGWPTSLFSPSRHCTSAVVSPLSLPLVQCSMCSGRYTAASG